MSEPIAARVEDSTAEWLETRAEQEDITVSKLAAQILDSQAGEVNGTEPDSTEAKLNQLQERLENRVTELEQDITDLCIHAESMEYKIFRNTELTNNVALDSPMAFPELPENSEENSYDPDTATVTSYRF